MVIKSILKAGNYGTDSENRTKISMLTSFMGLTLNIMLSIIKVLLFFVTGSVSILADAINNITDSVSSVVTIIGVKIAVLPADKKHPYGHGRIEYIAALVVSCFVFVTGIEFIRVSYDRIVNPRHISYSIMSIALMVLSVFVKFYMANLYKNVSKKIDSSPLLAQYKDSMGDVFITSVVILSIVIYKITNIMVDGYVGMLVSLFIIYSGYELIRDTLSDLIGEAPDEDYINKIEDIILSYDKILGIHNLVITNYGPVKTFVSLDAEIPYDMSLVEAHNLIDCAEREIKEKLKCQISIHIDPVGYYDDEQKEIVKILKKLVEEDKRIICFHDLTKSENTIRVIVDVDGNVISSDEDIVNISDEIYKKIALHNNVNYEVEICRSFFTEAK